MRCPKGARGGRAVAGVGKAEDDSRALVPAAGMLRQPRRLVGGAGAVAVAISSGALFA